jgi:hypothetical protein
MSSLARQWLLYCQFDWIQVIVIHIALHRKGNRSGMNNSSPLDQKSSWLDRPINSVIPKFTLEHVLIILIILAAIVSRFYNIGLRVMTMMR